ncbi:alpha-ribazole phosphatase [Nibrella saemangeumensis]|uniref:Alpha-ribazole phosphatase n=1 Tax=Nibrella saemangeumensis TaxID=1084526 RepID=A0ABP8NK49_9BACT
MDIYLIRHTEVSVGRRVCYGQADVELAGNYHEQRERLCALLPGEPAAVFASPLSRCRQLAEAIHPTVQFDNRLKEFNFGDWEMLEWSAIPPEFLDPWMADFVNQRVPNGETFQELFDRVAAFWHDTILPLSTGAPDSTAPVYVVTHGGVIRALLCLFLELSLRNAYRIHLDYGSVTKLITNGSTYTIQYINR